MDVAQIPPGSGDPLGGMRIGLEVAASIRPSQVIPEVPSPSDEIGVLSA